MLGVMGPNSRALLSSLVDLPLDSENFRFGQSIETEIGYAPCRLSRVSFVGELGWEILVTSDMATHVFDSVVKAGESHGLKLAGLHALDSCRLEKKFLHFGHDVADEDTPLEAGYRFVCAMDKAGGFIGRDAIAKQLDSRQHMRKRLVQFLLQDADAMLYHHEPILMDGNCVGYLTSGNYGHTLGGSVGLGYVKLNEDVTGDLIAGADWAIEVAGEQIAARASLSALYDPKGERMRS